MTSNNSPSSDDQMAEALASWNTKYINPEGFDGLAQEKPGPRQFWNRTPESVREQVAEFALEHPDKSPRQFAWHFPVQEAISSPNRVFIAF